MRRSLDLAVSVGALLVISPLLAIILFLVWLQDSHSPLYIADRAGLRGRPFKMVKIRSMIINADKTGVESTSVNDRRVTPLGAFIRKWKIDELGQLWNVLRGDMSLVGPRPNTLREIATYTRDELGLLDVRPGITDFSSIVFSDEGEILKDSIDPDADYTRLIRPWKSKLGLIYGDNASISLNLKLIWLTLVAIVDKRRALDRLDGLLKACGCDAQVREVASRRRPLVEFADSPSPGLAVRNER